MAKKTINVKCERCGQDNEILIKVIIVSYLKKQPIPGFALEEKQSLTCKFCEARLKKPECVS
ncbi:Uncharacterised protein [uncultured archaeon]|nr:Uncharacterised protein [uncultured archaeon]